MKWHYYRYDCEGAKTFRGELDNEKYKMVLWKPSIKEFIPKGTSFYPFLIWSLMHFLRIYPNRKYCVFLIYQDDRIIHHSVVTPKYFRFPFMEKADLQIGYVWTCPTHRGKGLAKAGIQMILDHHRGLGHRFWYLTEESNVASIKACEKAGFMLFGLGRKKKRLGNNLMGSYVIEEIVNRD
jgi:RimJ/RimL family protein N-acetyltransferase